MKIFDFSNGTKGQLLDDARRISWTSSWVSVKDEKGESKYLKVRDPRQLGNGTDLSVVQAAGIRDNRTGQDIKYLPEDYGVDAILFCMGQEHTGYGFQTPGDWKWFVVGTDEWVARAIANDFFVE